MDEIKWSHPPGRAHDWMAEAHGYIIEVTLSHFAYQYGIYKFTLGGVSEDPLKYERTPFTDMRRVLLEAEFALANLLEEERVCEYCGERLGDSPKAEVWNPATDTTKIVHQEPCAASHLLQRGWEIA